MEYPESALITGFTGFIGSKVARRLIDAGVRTIGLVNHARPPVISAAIDGMSFVHCEDVGLASLQQAVQAADPEVVIHLAAAGVSKEAELGEMLNANVDFTVNLVRAAADVGCNGMIHTGSCFEYADAVGDDLTDHSLVAPFSLYGATKAASVQLAIGIAKELQLPLVALRPFGIFGPGEAPQRLVPTIIRQLHLDQPANLTSGTQERDWCYIDDMAEAFVSAAATFRQLEAYTIYNVCTGAGHTVRQVGEAIARLMSREASLLRWDAEPGRSGEPQRIVGDNSRFCNATGWSPRNKLTTALSRTIEAFTAKHDLEPVAA